MIAYIQSRLEDSFLMGFGCAMLVAVAGYFAIMNVSDWDDAQRRTASVQDYASLPIEAFGYNYHIVRFRKHVYFPSNFENAFQRATEADQALDKVGVKSAIIFAPRTYVFKGLIPIASGTTIRANGATLSLKD